MKTRLIAGFALAATLAAGGLHASDGIRDDKIGLSKTSVFADPAPPTFKYRDADPARAGTLPRAWPDAPPQVPHKIDLFVPLTMDRNQCINCHDQPSMIGKKVKGAPTPMSASHYREVEGKKVRNHSQHICTLCHAPQAEVRALVGNTFEKK